MTNHHKNFNLLQTSALKFAQTFTSIRLPKNQKSSRSFDKKHSIWHSAKKFNKAVIGTTIITYEKSVHNLCEVSSSFADGISFLQLLQSDDASLLIATVSRVFTSSSFAATRISSCSEEF